ncbi:related to Mig1 protein, induced during biotrophic phase [Ustilago sp. UG-2017b]|nr:related to Mig1 protein, induced during biotrophic phase [Ustilago sp. UG-2017b]
MSSPSNSLRNMVASHYHSRSQTAASAPPSEETAVPARRCRIVIRLRPRGASAPAANPPASPVLARVLNPLAPPLAPLPLEPLFLGMDDDTIVSDPPPSPLLAHATSGLVGTDYSPASPVPNQYNLDARQPPQDPTTPECQAAWEAELARSPTPPPTADEIVDTVLASSRAATPKYRLEVQPLTPPPCWVGWHTPPPPPPDRHLPSNGEITGWAERFVAADLMAACLGLAGSVTDASLWVSLASPQPSPTLLVSATGFLVPAAIATWLVWDVASATSLPTQVWSTLAMGLPACSPEVFIRLRGLT